MNQLLILNLIYSFFVFESTHAFSGVKEVIGIGEAAYVTFLPVQSETSEYLVSDNSISGNLITQAKEFAEEDAL